MQAPGLENISIDALPIPSPAGDKLTISLLRLDRIHPAISGNKWFKLKFYIEDALAKKKSSLVTFGGAWSNHILATAAACKMNNLSSVGLIRGEMPLHPSSTLKEAAGYGMQLVYLSRSAYREKRIPDSPFINATDCYFVDEGGYGEKGANGAATIADYYQQVQFTHIICAVGTGTMMAGLIKSAIAGKEVMGISILRNNNELSPAVEGLLNEQEKAKPFALFHDYHFGGYAKHNTILTGFMNDFYRQTGIATDFVYTGKLLYGVYDLVHKNYFPDGSRILVIHSGGLQGNNSLEDDLLIF